MKKITILILLIIFCAICLITKKEDEVKTVFNEYDNNYNVYQINTSDYDITTNNLNDYFNNYNIISISPYINPIYDNVIKFDTFSFDNMKSMDINIENFTKMYIDLLTSNALTSEVEKVKYNGITIKKVDLYTTKVEIDKILSKYKKLILIT